MRLSVVVIALSLAGCAGYDAPLTAKVETSAERSDSAATLTNDGFYDGGVFDQDLLDLEPMRLD